MLNHESIKNAEAAITAINKLCGHCEICSPDCPVAIARRSIESLHYDLLKLEKEQK
ncbi:hypothetical protein [Pectinatus sottacetonis]|uniref:hypothetical protein n=1 Tax=Pectinatus sottacetonis TaxID=1002795 RepID=UPI0018C69710|nr:hypothetical protein [Pectinatus sottacetonis]